MCDGCNFGNHPSQIYHIRSLSNPNGCIIPSNWIKEQEEEEGKEEEEGDEEQGKKKAEEVKKEDISPLLFGDLTTTFASFWKNFKDENKERKIEYNSSKPLPLDDTRLRECGCGGELPLTCGRRGNRKYYEHQYD
jgi:hypothetical protein